MRTISIDYLELLGKRYVKGSSDPDVGLDCSGVVEVLFRREGVEFPEGLFRNEANLASHFTEVLGGVCDAELLDVVVSDPTDCGSVTNIGAVVIPGYQGMTLTAYEDRGIYAHPTRCTPGLVGIYRYRAL